MTNWTVIVQEPKTSFVLQHQLEQPLLELSLPSSKAANRIRTNFFDLLPQKTSLSPMLLDLCLISMVVYSADIKIPRDISSDRWTRSITIHMPVHDVARWQLVSEHLAKTLSFLSGDIWQFEFRAAKDEYLSEGAEVEPCDAVCLLSGGLDSLVGAIDLLASSKRVALVGHHGAGITNAVQQNVLERLQSEYGDQVAPFSFYVQAPRIEGSVNEQTMRARSFLFLCLGLAVCACVSKRVLTVAENGFISLNVPLTAARMGSLSTRTTHPFFIKSIMQLLRDLELDLEIELPYQFMTKGEMIRDAADQRTLRTIIPKTMSCTHPESGRYAGKAPTNHCGYCVPCIIRRAALNVSGRDPTKYNVSIKRNAPNSHSAKGRDLRAFWIAVKRYQSRKAHQLLFDVVSSGPLDPLNIKKFVDVFDRGMKEVISIL